MDCLAKNFIDFTSDKGYLTKSRSSLISPYFKDEFNLSAGHQYVIPILKNSEKEGIKKISINELCIRRIDFEKIGESKNHLLLFEMGVFGQFGYIDDLSVKLYETVLDAINFLDYIGIEKGGLYFTISEGAEVLGEKYPADDVSKKVLIKLGIQNDHIIGTYGRQNFIFSNGIGRPAGNSIEIFKLTNNSSFIEIASVNIYRYIYESGRLKKTINTAIGVGFGLERLLCVLNKSYAVYCEAPFSYFLSACQNKFFKNNVLFELNKTRLIRIFELIKNIVFILSDAEAILNTAQRKILKGFYVKLYSEIDYLNISRAEIIYLSLSVIKKHYNCRFDITTDWK